MMAEVFEWPAELLEMVQPGKKVRVFYSPGNTNNQLRHIRAIVDETHIVYRVWSKQRWFYKVVGVYQFYLEWVNGHLAAAR